MGSYLFYDIETTGLSHTFDQILDFAAIRTGTDLQEVERYQFQVRLRPDVIPAPSAMAINRMSVAEAMSGLCEYEATQRIHSLVNAPGTISVGYNSLGFDDLFLRFSFYRNLLPEYTHQYANGCGRMDLLPLAAMYRLFRPEVLDWPRKPDGKQSLKLEHLADANQLGPGRAHEALADAETALDLARRFAREGDMWRYCTGFFDKDIDDRRIGKLPPFPHEPYRKGFMIRTRFGSELNYQAPVLYLGQSETQRNKTLWLRLDSSDLAHMTREAVADARVLDKKLGEPGFVIPPREAFYEGLGGERRALVEENEGWLKRNQNLLDEIATHHCQATFDETADLDPDVALYQVDFASPSEKRLFDAFHAAPPDHKGWLIDRISPGPRRQLAIRILGRNYPSDLPEAYRGAFEAYRRHALGTRAALGTCPALTTHADGDAHAMRDYRGKKRLTPAAAIAEGERLLRRGDLDADQQSLVRDWLQHIDGMGPPKGGHGS